MNKISINKIFSIANIVFKESIRDKIIYLIVILAVAMIIISLLVAGVSLDQDNKMIIDFSLSAVALFGLIIVIFSGVNLVHKEIDKKTIYFLFSKPLKFSELTIGKFLGLSTVLLFIYAFLSAIIILLIKFKIGNYEWIILEAVLLNYFESLIVLSIVMLFSSFTSPISSIVYSFIIYLIGHSSEILQIIIIKTANPILKLFYQFCYYIFPNLEKFNIRNDIVFGSGIILKHFGYDFIYFLLYISLCLILTNIIISKREY